MNTAGDEYGVGIVGAGNIAAAHVDAIGRTVGAHLVGVASRSPAGAAALAAKHGVRAFDSVAALVADPAVDVVAVCTPSGAHLEPALQAVAAGKHVIVEKPLEVSVARAEEIVAAAERAGVAVATIFMSRFADANAFLHRAAAEGRLGRLVQGNAYVPWYRDQAYYDSGAWRGTKALDGGGALMNQAIHQLDLLLWVMGPVAEVVAYAATLAHERIEVEDTLVASLRFESGALGQLSAATSLWPGRAKTLEVYGTDGLAVVSDDVLVEWRNRHDDDAERSRVLAAYGGSATGGSSDPMAISFENHRRQYQEFVDSLRAGRPSGLGGRAGIEAVAVIEAVYRAAAEGRPVRPVRPT
ncbi:MAG: Gfo/Idh/MocA family oxidoreductase [Trueperaceae bacterium]|nr:Gfo/Idh/MocA family oxidoreductase [Trueperaceae bacterium]